MDAYYPANLIPRLPTPLASFPDSHSPSLIPRLSYVGGKKKKAYRKGFSILLHVGIYTRHYADPLWYIAAANFFSLTAITLKALLIAVTLAKVICVSQQQGHKKLIPSLLHACTQYGFNNTCFHLSLLIASTFTFISDAAPPPSKSA